MDLNNTSIRVKALIISGMGINCEQEMAKAYQLAGAIPTIVHINRFFFDNTLETVLSNYDIINFPGGFSYGDDLGSGQALANCIRYQRRGNNREKEPLLAEIIQYLKLGKFILGICNGFQVLVKLGLLPQLTPNTPAPEVTLTYNLKGKFEDRWCKIGINHNSTSPLLSKFLTQKKTSLYLPIRHGEGRLLMANDEIRKKIQSLHLDCLFYQESDKDKKENNARANYYPSNPNGSELAIAGLCDTSGQVLGMMPHPEAFLCEWNHPNARGTISTSSTNRTVDGLQFFKNIVLEITQRKLTNNSN
ncbi:MAG: phosphoribosylformylglycinamidine synthase subunit PurQ [Oligoflexia bacterium]|nr:phosphoribosylformylglycinamidine synthase subunit PurQ [Oligoflexia bacterium]